MTKSLQENLSSRPFVLFCCELHLIFVTDSCFSGRHMAILLVFNSSGSHLSTLAPRMSLSSFKSNHSNNTWKNLEHRFLLDCSGRNIYYFGFNLQAFQKLNSSILNISISLRSFSCFVFILLILNNITFYMIRLL